MLHGTLNIGNVYYQQEKFIKAREHYNEALDLFNSFKHNKDNRVAGRKVALSNLGRIEVKIKNYDKALKYFKEALEVSRNSTRFLAFEKARIDDKVVYEGNARGVAYQHHLISNLYILWKQYDLAIKENRKAESILKYILEKSELNTNSQVIRQVKILLGKTYLNLLKLIHN